MARSSVVVTSNTKLQKLLSEMFTEQTAVKIGLVAKPEGGGQSGDVPKESKDKDGNTIIDHDVDLAFIASLHEFGNESTNLPQRSFLRSTYNEKKDRIVKNLKIALKKQAASNNYDPESALRGVAVWMVGQVKKKFTSNDWEALKDPTRGGRNKDGKATPLVDTGQLRASIDYEIVKGKVKDVT